MDLRAKYGNDAFEAGQTLQPKTFERRVAQRDAVDQHFTRLWLDFAVKGLGTRPALDMRTRLLVLIGQYTMAKSHGALEDSIHAGLAAKVPVREIAEIVLQCIVYGGHTVVDPAIEVLHRVAEQAGLLDELRRTQQADAPDSEETERRKLGTPRRSGHDQSRGPAPAGAAGRDEWSRTRRQTIQRTVRTTMPTSRGSSTFARSPSTSSRTLPSR